MDCSPPGSSVHGIFQARILEWVVVSFSLLCCKRFHLADCSSHKLWSSFPLVFCCSWKGFIRAHTHTHPFSPLICLCTSSFWFLQYLIIVKQLDLLKDGKMKMYAEKSMFKDAFIFFCHHYHPTKRC